VQVVSACWLKTKPFTGIIEQRAELPVIYYNQLAEFILEGRLEGRDITSQTHAWCKTALDGAGPDSVGSNGK
jgi:hypothetical protein